MTLTSNFKLNRGAMIVLIIAGAALLGGGAWAGYALGTDNGKQQYVENPPKNQSVSGKVKSADKDGMTVTASNGEWKVSYVKSTTFRSGVKQVAAGDIKAGDTVRVVGTAGDKDKTVNARTVTKIVPRTSSPKPAAPAPAPF